MKKVQLGLEQLVANANLQQQIKGNIGYLCHSASIDSNYNHGIALLQKVFGKRLTKLFGPQHGLVSDVQDNMVETHDFIHPHYKLPVHSLYGNTRIPTDQMLQGVDTIIIDLQDVGTRVYTYISTMTLLMEKCADKDIAVVILDRPNPTGGNIIEGNILEDEFKSFVGRHPIPMRHSLTMAEMALLANKYYQKECQLLTIPMKNWKRDYFFNQCNLPWVLPSPNLPTADGSLIFAGSVIFEGTNISEGRGTTRSLELIGHPQLEPHSFVESITKDLQQLEGFVLRPIYFMPTFQKHAGQGCGGIQIHITNYESFRPWKLCQIICKNLYHQLGNSFSWNDKPYEYEFEKLSIDLINGSDKIRKWIEQNNSIQTLDQLEKKGHDQYLKERQEILIYK